VFAFRKLRTATPGISNSNLMPTDQEWKRLCSTSWISAVSVRRSLIGSESREKFE
jgi:hypothetical protein